MIDSERVMSCEKGLELTSTTLVITREAWDRLVTIDHEAAATAPGWLDVTDKEHKRWPVRVAVAPQCSGNDEPSPFGWFEPTGEGTKNAS